MEEQLNDLSFEEALKELQDLVEELEGGNVELEKSIALYEKGTKLKLYCEEKLKVAEAKISKVANETLEADLADQK